jgi:Icc-related predicted phosphoesterase
MMRIVAISDTHNMHHHTRIPDGDILIHAGDFTNQGTLEEVLGFERFFRALPHRHKIIIAGNHDFYFENFPEEAKKIMAEYTYLLDQTVTVEGIKFYGSPWQPRFQNWAFNLDRGTEIKAKWDLIPEDVDILITHGAPYGIGDQTFLGENIGCEELLKAVQRIQPKFHIFGHIHEGYGTQMIDGTTFVNAAICDMHYQAANPPTVLNL